MMKHKPIVIAAELAGGQASLARKLGVSPPTVHQWLHGERPVPAERCPAIERLLSGAVRCEDLRPDVDWAVLRQAAVMPSQAAAEACDAG